MVKSLLNDGETVGGVVEAHLTLLSCHSDGFVLQRGTPEGHR